jgi:hypothetical protein
MILIRYLGLALVLGVSTALVGVVVSQPSNTVRLFVRCLRWGLATGAATGAVFGGLVSLIGAFTGDPGAALGLTLVGVVIGGVAGAIVAILPALIGGLLVMTVLRQRHPHPASEVSVERDLTGVFAVVVATLDVILLVAVLASGGDFSSVMISMLLLVVGNACVVLMLWRARMSISRLWLEVAGG